MALAERPDAVVTAFERKDRTAGYIRHLLREAKREQRFGNLIEQGTPLPGEDWGKFAVVYADPPWKYGNEHSSAAAENTFPTMDAEEIIALREDLNLDEHLTDDCALFLWATVKMLPAAMNVMAGWGFAYNSHFIWKKPRPVIGSFAFWQHEVLLIGTRGSISPLQYEKPRSVFEGEPWSELNSAKPDRAYEIIEMMYPKVRKLELFARRLRGGEWKSWGNEVGHYEQPVDEGAGEKPPE